NDFAQASILTRNILKSDAGTRFVYLSYPENDWDMHRSMYDPLSSTRNGNRNIYRQSREWDQAFVALLEDLQSLPGHESGKSLLDETLIVLTSEFGRTPVVNNEIGRDHYAKVFGAALVGGGVKGRRIIGKSNEDASECVDTGWKSKWQP